MDERLNQLTEPLLCWYDREKRSMPWRDEVVPYHTWISEIMLQQTRVEAVMGYYARFLEALPTIEALANAPEDQLLKLWEGLGYYNRVRNLQKAARVLVENYGGELPADFEALQALPGVGSYTAGAIGAIAFSLPTPAVDGNVLRVATRITGSRENISKQKTKAHYEAVFAAILEKLPPKRRGDLVQALMELGALICVPNGAPNCTRCPANGFCEGYLQDIWDELPVKDEKKPRRIEEKTVLILHSEQGFWLMRRPKKGLLAGLWELPSIEGFVTEDEAAAILVEKGFAVKDIRPINRAKHIFSHIEWKMRGMEAFVSVVPQNAGYTCFTAEELQTKAALPSAFDAFRPYLQE